uniref:Putative nucleolar protein 58-like n=1 Tax=Solanum chacoense TaxID=4108 RepID=A0A0V0ICF9_SOLCH
MGACASKPNVLNDDAPEDALDNIVAKDVEVVVKEELVNKEDIVIVDNDDVDHTSSVDNLLNNEEGKGSTEEKEETLVKANEVACCEEDKYSEVQKVVDDGPKIDAIDDDKKIEHVKSQTSEEEIVKPSMESENKKDDQGEITRRSSCKQHYRRSKICL